MALNHLLYRPQVLERPVSPADQRIAELFMELVSRLVADGLNGGQAREKLVAGLNEAMQSLVTEVKSRLTNASTHLMEWLQPLINAFEALGGQLGDFSSASAGMQGIGRLLLMMADLLEHLTVEEIEGQLKTLLRIFTDDLGLTKARIVGMLNQAVDVIVQKMKGDYLGGDVSEQAHNEYLIGCYLEKLRRFVEEEGEDFDLDFDLGRIAVLLADFIRQTDWEKVRLAAQEMLETAGNIATALGILMDIFSGKFNVTVEVEVEVNGKVAGSGKAGFVADPVSWYATWFDRRVGHTNAVGVVDRSDLAAEPFFPRMSFKNLTPEFMEEFALWSDAVVDQIEAILHLRSIQPKDWVNNSVQATLQSVKSLMTMLVSRNNDQSWVDAYRIFGNWYFEYAVTLGTTFLTSLESAHLKSGDGQGIFWVTLLGKDFVESLLYNNWASRLRQGLLSFFTLLNADPVGKPSSENHQKVEGFAMVFGEIFSWIGATYTGRSHFGLPAHGGPKAFILCYLFGWLTSYAGAIGGWFLGWAISHSQQPSGTSMDLTYPKGESFGWMSLEALLAGLVKYPIYNYLLWNGNTAGGTFGFDNSVPRIPKTFHGYPPKASSPYRLPYAAGEVRQCAQGNNGVWSHNQNTNQVYAFDWDHDHGMDVLAIRGGTVADFSDVMHDHTTLTANTIDIRHDDILEGVIPNPIHDRDWTDAPVVTTANYIHGAHYSIRHIFAAMGIPIGNIKNTPVSRGQLVMFSGDTGMSFYNHLHMHVGSDNAMSLPFVFGDAPEDNGVLRDLNWYWSQNTRIADTTGMSIGHPEEQGTQVLFENVFVNSSTASGVRLFFYSNWIRRAPGAMDGYWLENIFNDCVVEYQPPAGGPAQLLRIIKSHQDETTSEVILELDGTWVTAPANGHAVRIMTRAGASTNTTLVLDALARNYSDTYTGRHILVWWKNERGDTIYEYKKIQSYDASNRKITIEQNWDHAPMPFAEYVIGGQPYVGNTAFYQRFAFIPGAGNPAPTHNLHNMVGLSHDGHHGNILGISGTRTIDLQPSAPNVRTEVEGRMVVVLDMSPNNPGAVVLSYAIATSYDTLNKKVTVDRDLPTGIVAGFHHYQIGGPKFADATQKIREDHAFLCPDTVLDTYTPKDFDVPVAWKSYQLASYKTW